MIGRARLEKNVTVVRVRRKCERGARERKRARNHYENAVHVGGNVSKDFPDASQIELIATLSNSQAGGDREDQYRAGGGFRHGIGREVPTQQVARAASGQNQREIIEHR